MTRRRSPTGDARRWPRFPFLLSPRFFVNILDLVNVLVSCYVNRLINCLVPGAVKKINTMKAPFKQVRFDAILPPPHHPSHRLVVDIELIIAETRTRTRQSRAQFFLNEIFAGDFSRNRLATHVVAAFFLSTAETNATTTTAATTPTTATTATTCEERRRNRKRDRTDRFRTPYADKTGDCVVTETSETQ